MLIAALLLAFLGAVLPTLLYVSVAWWLDRYEKEPWGLLALTFVWGAVPAVLLSMAAELGLMLPLALLHRGSHVNLLTVAAIAPVVEESCKALALLVVFKLYRHEFDGLMDGLLYGALVGFGFAMTENFIYIFGAGVTGGMEALAVVFFLRTIVFGMMHALWSSMLGLGLGLARYAQSRHTAVLAPCGGFLLAVALHALHNFCAVQGGWLAVVMVGSYALGCTGWLALAFVAGLREAQWIREELAEEVAAGLLTPAQAEAAARYRSRVATRWAALRERGWGRARQLGRLYCLAAALAFKKRQLAIHPHATEYGRTIEQLRGEIVAVQALLADPPSA